VNIAFSVSCTLENSNDEHRILQCYGDECQITILYHPLT
jgi:hypothetical protein